MQVSPAVVLAVAVAAWRKQTPLATLMGPHSSEWRLGQFLTRLANPSVCPADWRVSCLLSTSHSTSSQTLSHPPPKQRSPPTCDYKPPPWACLHRTHPSDLLDGNFTGFSQYWWRFSWSQPGSSFLSVCSIQMCCLAGQQSDEKHGCFMESYGNLLY